MNLQKRAGLYLAGILMCILSAFLYVDNSVYAEDNFTLNYSEVSMFTFQTVKLEVQENNVTGKKVSVEEYNKKLEEFNQLIQNSSVAFGSLIKANPEQYGFDCYCLEVSFESDNEKVLVSTDGVVSASPQISESTTATVSAKYVYRSFKGDSNGTLTCFVTYDNGKILGNDVVASGLTSYYFLSTTYTFGNVEWSVDNENVATVSSEGLLTTKAYGTVTIEVTVTDGDIQNTIIKKVKVSDPKFKKNMEALAVGGSFELEISGIYDESVKTYSSSKSKCVSVSKEGLVYSLKKTSKDVTITAVVDGRKITMTIKVTNPKFSRGEANPILLVKGKKLKLTVKGIIDGLSKVKYSSDKTDIATVTKAGRVKAKKYGSCYIVAEVDHKIVKINCAVGKKKAIKALKAAYSVYGCPYSQPKRMLTGYYDCSSLAWRSYRTCGIYVGNYKGKWASTAAEECKYLFGKHKRVSYKGCKTKKLRPGDLVFYSGWTNGRFRNITHVAIYVANDTLIEANWPNGVREASYSNNKKYIVGIGRPVK